jgi:hypothetical protein
VNRGLAEEIGHKIIFSERTRLSTAIAGLKNLGAAQKIIAK